MHSDGDVTRIVRSWLRTDEHGSADRVLDTVLAMLDTTPQRRSRWPARRFSDMNSYAKLLIAAAAVVVVAFVGINLLPSGGGPVGGPAASPTPTPLPSPTPSPSATPGLDPTPTPIVVIPPSGELAVGTRHDMTLEGVPFTFTVPTPDWISNGEFGIDKTAGIGPDGAGFIFWGDAPVGVFSDPCTSIEGPRIGSSAAGLAAAVAAIPGTDVVSGPSDVTVDGHPAKHVVITVREDVGCDPQDFYLWYAPTDGLARYATRLGSTIGVWIIDVEGDIVWIDGETYKGAGPEPAHEIQQIIDSIQFE